MNVPAKTLLGFLGAIALVIGIFLMLTGAGIIKIEKVTVEKSKKTIIMGFVLILFGIGGLWGEIAPVSRDLPIISSQLTKKEEPSLPKLPVPAIHTISKEGFDFALQGCEQDKYKKVACNIYITSKETDKTLSIKWWFESRIFDNFGYEYKGNNGQLANKSTEYNVSTLLVANIPVKSIVLFDGVSPDATSITRFDFTCYDVTDSKLEEKIEMQFRTIPLSKNQNNAEKK